MVALTDTDRILIRSNLARTLSSELEPTSLTKPEWKAAIDATDLWISDNQASFNNSLPVEAQVGLTKQQKARLLTRVAEKRFEVDA